MKTLRKYTPAEAIEVIGREYDAIIQETWHSDTLPELVEWLGMILRNTKRKPKKVGIRRPKSL